MVNIPFFPALFPSVGILVEAANDTERGIDFYNAIKDGVGLYFRDSIIRTRRNL